MASKENKLLVQYAILSGVIAFIAIAGMTLLGGRIGFSFIQLNKLTNSCFISRPDLDHGSAFDIFINNDIFHRT